jgi:hypothetical protein
MSFSTDQRRKQVSILVLLEIERKLVLHFGFTRNFMLQNPAAGIIGGFIKGMKGKAEENAKMRESLTLRAPSEQLESIFSKEPFAEPSIPDLDDPMEELSIGSLSPSLCIILY